MRLKRPRWTEQIRMNWIIPDELSSAWFGVICIGLAMSEVRLPGNAARGEMWDGIGVLAAENLRGGNKR